MAGRKKKQGGEGEHENAERWLLTYADMMTLLVAFFIMMYAMSILNNKKFQQLAVSIRSGFGGSITNGTPTVIRDGGASDGQASIMSDSWNPMAQATQSPNPSRAGAVAADQKRLDHVYQVLQTYIHIHHLAKDMQVSQDERGVIVTVLTDKMLFSEGQAILRPQEQGLLGEVSTVLNSVPDNNIRVEGHTDNLPIHTAQFPSNWELSADRATTVLRYFIAHSVLPARLAAIGYADQHPLASNTTDAGRARNRRVEIVVLRQT
jgi:chemotaxis protein MotB